MDDVRNTLCRRLRQCWYFSASLCFNLIWERQSPAPELRHASCTWLECAALLRLCVRRVVPVLYLLIFHVAWRRDRILAFLNPYSDPQRLGFHIIQSLIAVGTGGVTGLGLMEGKQKLFYLPEPQTDFIFAVTAEEWDCSAQSIVRRHYSPSSAGAACGRAGAQEDIFGRFLAVGITSMVVLQAFINISVVLGMMPTKGIPLPLVSYGGSSLFVTLACVGVLLNITKQAE